jgi:hypothetical protein
MSANKVLKFSSLLALLIPSILFAKNTETSVVLADGKTVQGVKIIERIQSDKELSLSGIIVGKSQLSDVKKRFQGNDIFHDGDAGASIYILCYTGSDGTLVAFESGGEMGGEDHTLTSAQVFATSTAYRFKDHCASSDKINNKIEAGGVHLGMTTDAVKKMKGMPSRELSDLILYNFEVEKKNKKGPYTVSSGLELNFLNNKLIHFELSKVESN